MSEITRATADALREGISKLAADHGLEVEFKSGRWDPAVGTYKPRVTFKAPGASKLQFERDARKVGLEPEDLQREFEYKGDRFRIVGVNKNAPKYPVKAVRIKDEKQFKFTLGAVGRTKPTLKELADGPRELQNLLKF